MTRITEQDLIIPALYVINKQPGLTTSELITELRAIFNPSGEDAEILKGRSDDKFSQIVRNLVSHHTLDNRLEYTILTTEDISNSNHTITKNGIEFLKNNIDALECLLSNNFNYANIIEGLNLIISSNEEGKKLELYDENLLISEGTKRTATKQVFDRSRKLREMAIKKYLKNGRIECQSCGFDFFEIYDGIGEGFIEIHHIKPIYQYNDTDTQTFFEKAINNVIPLCSNCHRMIHRNKKAPLSVQELKEIVLNQKVK